MPHIRALVAPRPRHATRARRDTRVPGKRSSGKSGNPGKSGRYKNQRKKGAVRKSGKHKTESREGKLQDRQRSGMLK